MIDESLRTEVSEFVRVRVDIADGDFRDIVAWALEVHHEGGDAAELTALAEELAAQEIGRHLAEQSGWTEPTESDRLTAAFRELDETGIVARENFTCCQGCGTSEIGAEATDCSGYAFYHQQDAEAAARSGGLHLAYGILHDGSALPDPADTAAIGARIVAALRRHDLPVEWNGEADKRIFVPITWQRRWLGDPGPVPAPAGGVDRLVVNYFDRALNNADVERSLTIADCHALLDRLLPREGNFATFQGRSGDVVQIYYEPQLWLESPDPAARVGRGRHATIAEVGQMIDILAREDRVALHELGALQTISWDP